MPVKQGRPGTSTAISRPSGSGTTRDIRQGGVDIASYDAKARRAHLTRSAGGGSGPAPEVHKGDVIASPSTHKLPKGALMKVTEVRPESSSGGVDVGTSPANLTDLLGNAAAQGKSAIQPDAWKVKPLLQGLDVDRREGNSSFHAGENGVKGNMRPGTLRVGVGAPLPLPQNPTGTSAEAKIDGYIEMTPSVAFSYHRDSAEDDEPASASIKLNGAYKAGLNLNGTVQTKVPIRIPFAKVMAFPVIMVGVVPVVVSVGFTMYFDITASGKVGVKVSQQVRGSMTLGAEYEEGDGWDSINDATGDAKAAAGAKLMGDDTEIKTAVAAEATLGLYDMVGVGSTFAPYLRGEVEGTPSDWNPFERHTDWKLYGGFDLNGFLFARLSVFGFHLMEHRLKIPIVNREWRVQKGEYLSKK